VLVLSRKEGYRASRVLAFKFGGYVGALGRSTALDDTLRAVQNKSYYLLIVIYVECPHRTKLWLRTLILCLGCPLWK